jgi:hypothetical protein
MKTLKQFQEATGYLKVKSPDEQKFVDKHEVETMDDQNGNGDEVFKASKVKKVARKAERKGYEPGEDESVYEEVEELDELSRSTLRRYRMKAKSIGDNEKGDIGYRSKGRDLAARKTHGGQFGIPKAKVMASEEAEQVDEISKELTRSYFNKALDSGVRAASRQWRPGSTSDANAAAAVAKKRAKGLGMAKDRLAKEEAENLDEISKATMGRYINRAKDQIDTVSYRQGHRDSRGAGGDPISRKHERKLSKRHGGIELAVKKLTREEADYLINRYADFKENISGLAPRLQEALHDVLDRLNEENQDMFMTSCQTEEGLEKMVAFAIENRGE